MALTDLLQSDPPPPARPPGVTCEHYAPSDGPRCAAYLPNGACARPDEFMCVEWVKRNGARPAPAPRPAAPPARPLPTVRPGALLTRQDVESFKALGAEVEVRTPLGTFWLVPARTGKPRLELLPEELLTVVNVVQVFGGRVVALTRDGAPLADADPAALAAVDAEACDEPAPADAPAADAGDRSDGDAREHLRRLRESVAGSAQGSLFAARGEPAR